MLPIQFTIIAAVGPTGELGKGDELIYRHKADMAHFVRLTTDIGHVVVGRKTWNAIPDKYRPLSGRKAYVLSRSPSSVKNGAHPDVTVCGSVEELQRVLNSRGVHAAAVIGGAEIYRLFEPMANEMVLSHFVEPRPDADVQYPDWPVSARWEEAAGSKNAPEFSISWYRPSRKLQVTPLEPAYVTGDPPTIRTLLVETGQPKRMSKQVRELEAAPRVDRVLEVPTAVGTGEKDDRVLTVPRATLDRRYDRWKSGGGRYTLTTGFSGCDALRDVEWAESDFRPRNAVETDPTFLQPIPYVLVQREEDGAILAYRRPSKIRENRLAGKRSIGFGGHVDRGDRRIGKDNSVDTICRQAGVRELREEIGLRLDPARFRSMGLVFEEQTEVGKVHIGLVLLATLPSLELAIAHDPEEIVELTWCPRDYLTSVPLDEFELWTRLVIDGLLRR